MAMWHGLTKYSWIRNDSPYIHTFHSLVTTRAHYALNFFEFITPIVIFPFCWTADNLRYSKIGNRIACPIRQGDLDPGAHNSTKSVTSGKLTSLRLGLFVY